LLCLQRACGPTETLRALHQTAPRATVLCDSPFDRTRRRYPHSTAAFSADRRNKIPNARNLPFSMCERLVPVVAGRQPSSFPLGGREAVGASPTVQAATFASS